MSVATKNPFAILEFEEADAPPTPPPKQADDPAPPRPQKTRGGPASRGGKYYPRGGSARQPARDAPQNAVDETPVETQKRSDGEARGRGRGRGARGARGGAGGRGRQFDRHSATGKTDSEKKIHNSWGGDDGDQELRQEEAASKDAAAEGAAWAAESGTADWGAPADNADAWAAPADATPQPADADKPAERDSRRREEEEDNTLTLDQYLAKKKESTIVPKIEATRKANEGAEDNWKDVVPLQKNPDESAYFVGKTKSAPKTRAPKAEKIYLEIDAHFDRPDRGGRGRGRGGRGRAAPRGGPRSGRASDSQVVNVDDEAAFPSLS